MVDTVKPRKYYTYRCKNCGFECRSKKIESSSVPATKRGSYGNNATPQPTTFDDEMYEAATISFTAASGSDPAYLSDSENRFGEKGFSDGMTLKVETTSATNDGTFTIGTRAVTGGKIELSDDDSLTTEDAATAGTVTLSRVIYKPQESGTGCPFCNSLNSK